MDHPDKHAMPPSDPKPLETKPLEPKPVVPKPHDVKHPEPIAPKHDLPK
jgi:hypothetical protein